LDNIRGGYLVFRFFNILFYRIVAGMQLWILLLSFLSPVLSGQEILLKGRVLEKATNQPLNSVTVRDKATQRGTITDDSGVFKISLPAGSRNIEFSYIGFEHSDTAINLTGSTELLIFLSPSAVSVGEITISAEALRNHVSSPLMGSFTLNSKEIMKLPSLLGESDAFKMIQLTPGVKSGSYGGAGFYVRGGGNDQNLILFDNTIVYNPGHLLGIFSVFNPGIVREVSIIKSGMPAQFGGRLSSVILVNSYRGNKDSLEFTGSTGLISSRFTVSGPLWKKKGTFVIGARRTYLGLIVKPIVKQVVNSTSFLNKDNIYNFYDFNAGASYRITAKDFISFSTYQGRDKYKMDQAGVKQENYLKWGNNVASMQWNHSFNENSYMNTKVSWTRYEFNLSGSQADYYFSLFSAVEDFSLKGDISLRRSKSSITAGYELIDHSFIPREINARAGNFMLNLGKLGLMHALEGGIYVSDEFSISPKLTMTGGLRLSFFDQIGPYTEFVRDKSGQVSDTLAFPQGKSLAFYMHPEPRLVLKYQMNNNSSLKASYMRIAQYIHLATSGSASLPTDIWIPSTAHLKPLLGDQLSLGYFTNFPVNGIEFSAEVYYKKMQNQIEFLKGIVNVSVEGNIEDNIAVGFAQSYGLEFYIARKMGKTTGWLSYTLSRTEQKFDRINSGYFYPAKYDARHDVSFTCIRQFSQKWSGSVVFVYISGNAYTMPVGRYIIQGSVVNQYGTVNGFRLPPNHRMDVSVTRKLSTRKNRDSELVFSVYNVYNRANPYFIYYEVLGDIEKYSLEVKASQVTLIPIIPSVSWNFKF
jgi:hypothetical protein